MVRGRHRGRFRNTDRVVVYGARAGQRASRAGEGKGQLYRPSRTCFPLSEGNPDCLPVFLCASVCRRDSADCHSSAYAEGGTQNAPSADSAAAGFSVSVPDHRIRADSDRTDAAARVFRRGYLPAHCGDISYPHCVKSGNQSRAVHWRTDGDLFDSAGAVFIFCLYVFPVRRFKCADLP